MSEEKKEYWKPSVTADVVPVNIQEAPLREDGAIVNVILIKRSDKTKAFPNTWAFPGGFLYKGESIEHCAARELKEETGIDTKMLLPIGVFSAPNRDPRDQVISTAFLTVLVSTPEQPLPFKAGDDAKEINRFKIKGKFNQKDGTLDVFLRCAATNDKIEFSAKFGRGDFGLVTTTIEYKDGEGYSRLAFDHAEILARAILKAPDIILPTKTNPKDEEDNKKQLAEHLAR